MDIPEELKMQHDPLDQVYRTQYLICVVIGELNLKTDVSYSHRLDCQRASVLFMKEPDFKRIQNWIHYADQTLALKGFIQILSLTDFRMEVEDNKVKASIQQVSVQMCSDTLTEFQMFLKLAQLAAIKDVEEIEKIIEQSVGRSSQTNAEKIQTDDS